MHHHFQVIKSWSNNRKSALVLSKGNIFDLHCCEKHLRTMFKAILNCRAPRACMRSMMMRRPLHLTGDGTFLHPKTKYGVTVIGGTFICLFVTHHRHNLTS